MNKIEAIKRLHYIDRQDGTCVYTKSDLRTIFHEDNTHALDAGLKRLVEDNILMRAVNGVYVYMLSDNRENLIEHIARAMRRGEYNYVSLESALSEYGVLSQVPMRLTVMTTGRGGVYHTPLGTIEFTHTKRNRMTLPDDMVDVGRPLKLAKKMAAYRDLKRAGRNVHQLDEDVLYEEDDDTQTHCLGRP